MSIAIEGKLYNAAIYMRLSKEDGDKIESDSIGNQRDLIRAFLKTKPEITIKAEKVEACDIIEPNRGSLVNRGFRVVWSKLYYSQGLIPRPLISRT